MSKPTDRVQLLEDINRMLAETTDEASRRDLERLRDSLNSPQMLEMAQALESQRPAKGNELVLHFHIPVLPTALTGTVCVLTGASCLYAATLAWKHPILLVSGTPINLWLVTVLAGALSIAFTALSLKRDFFVRADTEGMVTRHTGRRWRLLQSGALRWKDIRSLQERADRILEIRAAGGEVFEVPMKLVNYKILKAHLDNMVMLYGEVSPASRT